MVFEATLENISSFTFGSRKENNEVHIITANKNVAGHPEVGLITARS
jgi:hypothetical protein